MAKERNLPSKTTFTTSDYIRVVGSDNVSYKQPVSNILSTWGIDKLTGELPSSFSGDANTLTSTGQWQIGNPANVQNLPSGANYGILAVESATSYIYQRYINLWNIIVYHRRSVDGGTNWSAWVQQPTREEIDALNSKTFTTLTKSTSIDVFEYYAYKYGSLFMGYIVFRPSNDIADDGEIVSAGVPTLISSMQLPITCVAGTQAGQTGRCRIGNGKIVNWYSAMSIKAGNTYLIPVNALCA